ncbi:MAG: hypothetical protein CMB37_04270 [Euryarchaeota archaeon]|nr:hypothetical protein [Euryarchaeota archaeon]
MFLRFIRMDENHVLTGDTSMTAEPTPCRDGDHGKFEITNRDGWARLGKFHTSTHVLETPCLLPVINPNIRTVEPRELWEKYGFKALITNSYVIWKHESLKKKALSDGVHALLDYPGVIMTDSGTFQNYVYGDVEVGVEEIVKFQREIGVDIATMLDVFGTPSMTEEEILDAVNRTIERASASLAEAKDTMLNGPIQGGTYPELRKKSAIGMGAHPFSVHPIGGIVPLMERQRYKDLVEIILSCREHLPWNRPIHMFGCGHPHLFPICVALGADLFDSAAYALFARDDRMLMPWGTVKLSELNEFPISTAALHGHTPKTVLALSDDARCELLARHNLEVTASEMARCRQAVRDGTIWQLVEERSHTNAALREATEYLYENMPEGLISSTNPLRDGGVQFSQDLPISPPAVASLGRLLSSYNGGCNQAIVFTGSSGPWREKIGGLVHSINQRWPGTGIFIETPIGVIPYSLEDVSPWAHLVGPTTMWGQTSDEDIRFDVEALVEDIGEIIILSIEDGKMENLEILSSALGDGEKNEINRSELDRSIMVEKVCYFFDISIDDSKSIMDGCTFVYSRTKRVRNVYSSDGKHLFSPRMRDGGISLTIEGAKKLQGAGVATVVVIPDSEPFTRAGRNVMHGFISEVRGDLTPGLPCIIESEAGELLAHGVSQCTAEEARDMRKGIAIKVRDGIGES